MLHVNVILNMFIVVTE